MTSGNLAVACSWTLVAIILRAGSSVHRQNRLGDGNKHYGLHIHKLPCDYSSDAGHMTALQICSQSPRRVILRDEQISATWFSRSRFQLSWMLNKIWTSSSETLVLLLLSFIYKRDACKNHYAIDKRCLQVSNKKQESRDIDAHGSWGFRLSWLKDAVPKHSLPNNNKTWQNIMSIMECHISIR